MYRDIQDRERLFYSVVHKRYRWLLRYIKEDIIQECQLFVHIACSVGSIVLEDRGSHRQKVYDLTNVKEYVKAVDLYLSHIACDYGYRSVRREKQCRGVSVEKVYSALDIVLTRKGLQEHGYH